MQLIFTSKWATFTLQLGKPDADVEEVEEVITLFNQVGGDFQPAPVPEYVYYEEEDQADTFGFSPR